MGLLDVVISDGTVEMKHGEYYNLMKEAAKAEIIMNAVKCGVPHEYIMETMTGKKEEHPEIVTVKIATNMLKEIIDVTKKERMERLKMERNYSAKEEESQERQRKKVEEEQKEGPEENGMTAE